MEEVQKVIIAFGDPQENGDLIEGNSLGDETAEYFEKKFKK